MACVQLLLGTAPNWNYTPEQLSDAPTAMKPGTILLALQFGNADACKLLIAAGADTHGGVTYEGALIGYADLARILWPDRPELAALFDAEAVQEPLELPSCAHCQKSGVKLKACSKCHAAQYCSTACQRAHWRAHKPACRSTKDVHESNIAKYNF